MSCSFEAIFVFSASRSSPNASFSLSRAWLFVVASSVALKSPPFILLTNSCVLARNSRSLFKFSFVLSIFSLMIAAITPSSSLVFSLIGLTFEVLLFINLKTSIRPFCIVRTGLKKYLTTTMIAMMTEIKNRLNIKICLFEAL